MKICLAQLNYHIGDFEGNRNKILNAIQEAKDASAQLVVFSELAVCGYPPEDLLDYPWFVEACMNSVREIAQACKGISCIVGSVAVNEGKGRRLFNSAYLLEDGKITAVQHKSLLPIEIAGLSAGLLICEDLWDHYNDFSYSRVPMADLHAKGAKLLLNPSASPFQSGKELKRREVLQDNARRFQMPIVYVNQVGAHAELIFDGNSMVVDADGTVVMELPRFRETLAYVNLGEHGFDIRQQQHQEEELQLLEDALVFGIQEYCEKNGFRNIVLGSSGGIDSAVVQTLASKALGPQKVQALLMPSAFSSEGSVHDAVSLSENLGNPYSITPITDVYESFLTALKPSFGDLPFDVTEENLQARIRGQMLMSWSNKFGHLLLNTSNKSEMAVGYSTLYGDLCGGLSPLGDVYKTRVYALAHFLNRERVLIPEAILTKEPSAELRPGQKDSDSLPPYEVLDAILEQYIESRLGSAEIIDSGFDPVVVNKVLRLVNRNEYKRFQAPPILRVSGKAFGGGRKMPLVARYV
jgi:NAD+ synthase (glutamine-hydrolysing)